MEPSPKGAIRILRVTRYESALSKDLKPVEIDLTMIVLTITLIDRIADYGIVAGVLAWPPMNLPFNGGQATRS